MIDVNTNYNMSRLFTYSTQNNAEQYYFFCHFDNKYFNDRQSYHEIMQRKVNRSASVNMAAIAKYKGYVI